MTYRTFTRPKASGGERIISAPDRWLAAEQQRLLALLEPLVVPTAASHGFVAGRSILTNAAPHKGRTVVLRMDLQSFFHTIDVARVKGLLMRLGLDPVRANRYAITCTQHIEGMGRVLPQGACTSPFLSNLACVDLDARMTALCALYHYRYTRYADDLTMSGLRLDCWPTVLGRAATTVRECGFRVNAKKTAVMLAHCRQSVTGIVVNSRLSVNRTTRRKVRAILHRLEHSPELSTHTTAQALGLVSHLRYVEGMNK